MTSTRQTLEQLRAKYAWDDIQEVAETYPNAKKKYGTFARRFPSMVQMNGLGATLAFLTAKGKSDKGSGESLLFTHISDWVLTFFYRKFDDPNVEIPFNDLLELIRRYDTDVYRRATTEAIAYGIWLKRYVEAQGDDWGSSEGDEN